MKRIIPALKAWLAERQWKAWDRQIERDIKAGRLDHVIANAEEEYRAGLAKPMTWM
jgi:hypothetical protein